MKTKTRKRAMSPEDADAAQMAIRMARAVASEKHDKAERYGDDAPGASEAGNKIDRGCSILESLLAKAQPAKKGGGHE